MRVIVFDTETTGLPTEKNPSITETSKWPYIVQLSYIIYDFEMNNIICSYDEILKLPDGVEISEESIKLHKITKERNQESGVNRKIALYKFNKELQDCDVVVGHNISFDKRMIMVECIRNGVQQYFNFKGKKKLEFCTMKSGTDICMIEKISPNGNKYFKYPTLSELYYKLFNEIPSNTHNAYVDILLCLRCYCKLIYNKDLITINDYYRDILYDMTYDISHIDNVIV